MGQPPAPGFAQGVGVIFRMQIRRLVRGRKLRLAMVATSLVVFSVVAARYASQRDGVGAERAQELAEDAMKNGLGWGFFKLLCFLLPFLFTSGAIAEEVEGRTFAFVSSRPVSRPAIAVGWAAGAVLSVALLAGSAILLHLVAPRPIPRRWWRVSANPQSRGGAEPLGRLLFGDVFALGRARARRPPASSRGSTSGWSSGSWASRPARFASSR
ncbi:MAG: hypothetical protein R3B99_01690 [Polyangiales bacterium]